MVGGCGGGAKKGALLFGGSAPVHQACFSLLEREYSVESAESGGRTENNFWACPNQEKSHRIIVIVFWVMDPMISGLSISVRGMIHTPPARVELTLARPAKIIPQHTKVDN